MRGCKASRAPHILGRPDWRAEARRLHLFASLIDLRRNSSRLALPPAEPSKGDINRREINEMIKGIGDSSVCLGLSAPLGGSLQIEVQVALYRLDFLDTSTGQVCLAREFQADTDEAAIAYADDARGMSPMELWNGLRKIKRWEAFPLSNH
jgi:hypothetical protein